jgi:cyclopropane-fatty-acyl-phospholipid synthase
MTTTQTRAFVLPKDSRAFSSSARIVLSRLAAIEQGEITMRIGEHTLHLGRPTDDHLRATVRVHDPRMFSKVLFGGSIGAAEAYINGDWSSDNVESLVRIFVRNQNALQGMESGLARLALPLQKLRHWLRDNTRKGSRRNISAHYDLSNSFFEEILDPTMSYSCALFERPEMSLEQASIAKIDAICRKLDLQPHDHLVEIGTGWGALAIHAARNYGCRVTTTTISAQQHALASARIREAGLEDRITLLFEDYRDLQGSFDKLVSVEMIEAVGARWYETYFRTCSRLLKPGGKGLIQAITIRDQHYARACNEVDFIQRYVFPGSTIPSVTALCNAMTQASELRITGLEDITQHYVRTLQSWRENLHRRRDAILAQGRDESFLRLWDYYFAYCAGGFAEHHIGTVHMEIAKTRHG